MSRRKVSKQREQARREVLAERERRRVAELGGEPYREPGAGRSVRQWLGLTGGDGGE